MSLAGALFGIGFRLACTDVISRMTELRFGAAVMFAFLGASRVRRLPRAPFRWARSDRRAYVTSSFSSSVNPGKTHPLRHLLETRV